LLGAYNTQEDEEDELGVQDSGYLFRLDPEEMLVEVCTMSDFSVSLQLRSGKKGRAKSAAISTSDSGTRFVVY